MDLDNILLGRELFDKFKEFLQSLLDTHVGQVGVSKVLSSWQVSSYRSCQKSDTKALWPPALQV